MAGYCFLVGGLDWDRSRIYKPNQSEFECFSDIRQLGLIRLRIPRSQLFCAFKMGANMFAVPHTFTQREVNNDMNREHNCNGATPHQRWWGAIAMPRVSRPA